jgi:hypothetical protein
MLKNRRCSKPQQVQSVEYSNVGKLHVQLLTFQHLWALKTQLFKENVNFDPTTNLHIFLRKYVLFSVIDAFAKL